jgi:WD40 repeat protein
MGQATSLGAIPVFSIHPEYVAPSPISPPNWSPILPIPRVISFPHPPNMIVPVGFDKLLVSFSQTNSIQLWDIHSKTIERDFRCQAPIYHLDGNLLYTTAVTSGIRMFDLTTGQKIISQEQGRFLQPCFTNNGDLLYYVDNDSRMLCIRDMRSHSLLFESTFNPMLRSVRSLPNNKVVLNFRCNGDKANVVKIMTLGTENSEYGPKFVLPQPVVALLPVNNGGNVVMICGARDDKEYVIRVGDVKTGQIVHEAKYNQRVLYAFNGSLEHEIIMVCDYRPNFTSTGLKKGLHFVLYDWKKNEFVSEMNHAVDPVREIVMGEKGMCLVSGKKVLLYYGHRFETTTLELQRRLKDGIYSDTIIV